MVERQRSPYRLGLRVKRIFYLKPYLFHHTGFITLKLFTLTSLLTTGDVQILIEN